MDAGRSSATRHVAVLLGATVLGGLVGWWLGGALVGVGLGLALGAAATVGAIANRLGRVATALDGPGPDLSELQPKQALATLSALAGGGQFDSPQMRGLEVVAEKAKDDPSAALGEARRLLVKYPRSPLVTAEVSRRYRAMNDETRACTAAADAIALALDGGMNPMAAKLLAEFKSDRDKFKLSAEHRARLAGAARAAGDDSGAAWCKADLG